MSTPTPMEDLDAYQFNNSVFNPVQTPHGFGFQGFDDDDVASQHQQFEFNNTEGGIVHSSRHSHYHTESNNHEEEEHHLDSNMMAEMHAEESNASITTASSDDTIPSSSSSNSNAQQHSKDAEVEQPLTAAEVNNLTARQTRSKRRYPSNGADEASSSNNVSSRSLATKTVPSSSRVTFDQQEEDGRRHMPSPHGPLEDTASQVSNVSSSMNALRSRYFHDSYLNLKSGTLVLDDSNALIVTKDNRNIAHRISILHKSCSPNLSPSVNAIMDEFHKMSESRANVWAIEQFKQWRQSSSSSSNPSTQQPATLLPVIPDTWVAVLQGKPAFNLPLQITPLSASHNLQTIFADPGTSTSSFVQLLDWIVFHATHPSFIADRTKVSVEQIQPICVKVAINAYYWLTVFSDMTAQHEYPWSQGDLNAINVVSSPRFTGTKSMMKCSPSITDRQILLNLPYNPTSLHDMRFPYGKDTSGGLLYYVASKDLPGLGMLYSQVDFNLLIRTFKQGDNTTVELRLSKRQVMVVDLLPASTRQLMNKHVPLPAASIFAYYDYINTGVQKSATTGLANVQGLCDATYIESNDDVFAEPLVCALSPMTAGLATLLPRSQHSWMWNDYTTVATNVAPTESSEVIFMDICTLLLD